MKSDVIVVEYDQFQRLREKMKEMRRELEVLTDEKLKTEIKNKELIRQVAKISKERDDLRDKYERFDANKRKVKNNELKRKKRLVRGRFREIVRQYHETKSIKEIYEICRERGYTGTYNTMRLSVLDFEVEQFMESGMTSLQIQDALRKKRPKSKITVETVEKMMKSLTERKGTK